MREPNQMAQLFELEPITRLSRDLREAAASLSDDQIRYFVSAYYAVQKYRLATEAQVRALTEAERPGSLLSWLTNQMDVLERQVKTVLDKYTSSHPVGVWMKSQKGIGPVISAGMLAHIDIKRATHVSHIWRFAGLDPSIVWRSSDYVKGHIASTRQQNKGDDWAAFLAICKDLNRKPIDVLAASEHYADTGAPVADDAMRAVKALAQLNVKPRSVHSPDNILHELLQKDKLPEAYKSIHPSSFKFDWKEITHILTKRPWNAELKTLCYKLGESFVFVSGDKNPGYYGLVYRTRKEHEQQLNSSGRYAEIAANVLATGKYKRDTVAKSMYSQGRLPDAHIHRRACRYAVKLFLAHLHARWYEFHHKRKPPMPYVIDHLHHGDYIPPPLPVITDEPAK